MELIQMQVGQLFPIEKIVKHFKGTQGGASLDYNQEDKTLSMYIGIPKPNSHEIRTFRNDPIRFGLYPNEQLDTSVIMVSYGVDFMFDLLYDINVLNPDMDGLVEGNRFDMYLIDSDTGILKGMRVIGVGENFLKEVNKITKNDGRYTTKEYNSWIQNDVHRKPITQLWRECKRIDWDN